MKDVIEFLAGVLVTSLGYLFKRRLEKSSVIEDLDIQLKLLEINKQMKEQNVTPEQLERMRNRLPSAKPSTTGIVEFAEQAPEFKTQLEMNEFAEKEFRTLQLELEITVKALSSQKTEAWKKQFQESQVVWLEYRNRQAQLAADQFKGGTIAPFIYITEVSNITKNRITELRLMLFP
jgi:uncharacterized protein YecT (DUF1311 family)